VMAAATIRGSGTARGRAWGGPGRGPTAARRSHPPPARSPWDRCWCGRAGRTSRAWGREWHTSYQRRSRTFQRTKQAKDTVSPASMPMSSSQKCRVCCQNWSWGAAYQRRSHELVGVFLRVHRDRVRRHRQQAGRRESSNGQDQRHRQHRRSAFRRRPLASRAPPGAGAVQHLSRRVDVHPVGTSCDDMPVFTMSNSDDGHLIECDPGTRVWSSQHR
jgi:hypothetical protein